MTLRHLNNRYRGSEKILRVENFANIKSIFIIIIIIIITIIIIMIISAIHPPKCELDGPASLSSSNLAFRLYLTGITAYISQPICCRSQTKYIYLTGVTDFPLIVLHHKISPQQMTGLPTMAHSGTSPGINGLASTIVTPTSGGSLSLSLYLSLS